MDHSLPAILSSLKLSQPSSDQVLPSNPSSSPPSYPATSPPLPSISDTSSSQPSDITPSQYPPQFTPPEIKKERAVRRKERRFKRHQLRLQARYTPLELEQYFQRRSNRQKTKQAEALLLKETCTKREIKRARQTLFSPHDFQDIDIHSGENSNSACEQIFKTHDRKIGNGAETTEIATFAGLIMVQNRLEAMRQALSEHTKGNWRRTEPGRLSFYVDAAVSRHYQITGIAVVYKTGWKDWASVWTAKGYRIHEELDQTEAELWAIWQGLQVALEKAYADRAIVELQDPCRVVVIYSDCTSALEWIRTGRHLNGDVVQKIIAQSVELQNLGIEVQLHWVQGHRSVPGNSLADLVSRRALKPKNLCYLAKLHAAQVEQMKGSQ